MTQLGSGLGSAPIGLDRAAASETRILVFRRIGKKVAAEVENSKFVASSGDPDEQRAVDTSFATSTLWMGDVVNTAKDGSYTVDLSGFLARDDMGMAQAMWCWFTPGTNMPGATPNGTSLGQAWPAMPRAG